MRLFATAILYCIFVAMYTPVSPSNHILLHVYLYKFLTEVRQFVNPFSCLSSSVLDHTNSNLIGYLQVFNSVDPLLSS